MRIKALFLFLSIFSTICFYSFESSAQENAPIPVIDLYLSVGMYSSALAHILIDMEWSAGMQYYVISKDKIGIEFTMRNMIDVIRFHDLNDNRHGKRKIFYQILLTNEYKLLQYGLFSLGAKNGIGYNSFNYRDNAESDFVSIYGLPLLCGLTFNWQLASSFSIGIATQFTPVIAVSKSKASGSSFFISGDILLTAIFTLAD